MCVLEWLYYTKVEFASTYELKNPIITNWDQTVGKDPVVSERAICSFYSYDYYYFVNINSITDSCDTGNRDYHLLDIKGDLVVNKQPIYLTSSVIELRFNMKMNVDQKEVSACCILTEVTQNSSDKTDLLQCLVKGSTTFQILRQVLYNPNSLFIEGTNILQFKAECNSSWLSLSGLLLFALLLL